MHDIADHLLPEPRGIFAEKGTVLEATAIGLFVETPSGRFEAARAISCLVAPEPGDEVLLAVPPEGSLYVLAVLARSSSAPISLRMDRDASLESEGTLRLSATSKVEIRSPGEVETVARKVSTRAVEGEMAIDRFAFISSVVSAHTREIKGVLGMVDTVLERLSQKMKRSYRYVEELDMTRAGQVDLRAKRSMSLHAQNTQLHAEQLVKVQADQIHLG